ncbi:MAG: FAD-binding protein [Bacteroidales bacterium]|nr:FAD-binding protein [Bacteroidales bacterium]
MLKKVGLNQQKVLLMMIYPVMHYTMVGLWGDYELMINIPGLYAIGEINFSDHGANRLRASALMQGLADGYFVLPYTIGNYLANELHTKPLSTDEDSFVQTEKAVKDRINKLMNIKGKRSVDYFHKKLGQLVWEYIKMARNEKGLKRAITEIAALRIEFWSNANTPGTLNGFNPEVQKANNLADSFELAELKAHDALERNESCGGHFREESQTEEVEALRKDDAYSFVSCWKYTGYNQKPELIKENLIFEEVELIQRNYK